MWGTSFRKEQETQLGNQLPQVTNQKMTIFTGQQVDRAVSFGHCCDQSFEERFHHSDSPLGTDGVGAH